MIPRSTDRERETGFFFMTLAFPETELPRGYSQYRFARQIMLETYALALLRRYSYQKRIVGIATEPPSETRKGGASEDLILVEPKEWTPEVLRSLEAKLSELDIAQEGRIKEYHINGNEFPDVKRRAVPTGYRLNRKQRRAKAAKERNKK
jgi:hypothetical protein